MYVLCITEKKRLLHQWVCQVSSWAKHRTNAGNGPVRILTDAARHQGNTGQSNCAGAVAKVGRRSGTGRGGPSCWQYARVSRNIIVNDRASRCPKKLPSTAKTGKRGRPVKLNKGRWVVSAMPESTVGL